MGQHIIRKRTWAGNEIIQTDIGLLPDKIWKSPLRNYPTELSCLIRKRLPEKIRYIAEKFNPTGRYFGYRARNSKDKAYIYVQKKNLVIDLCISHDFEKELKLAGFEVWYRDNFQGRAGWLTGWKIPQSTLNIRSIVRLFRKAFEEQE